MSDFFAPSSIEGTPSAEVQTVARYDFIVIFEGRFWDRLSLESEEIEYATREYLGAIREHIEEDFGNQVRYFFQGDVTVIIERLESGSIFGTVALVLATGVSVYQFVAKYHDFHESLLLLRQHLRSAIVKALGLMGRQRPPSWYRVNVALTRVPILRCPQQLDTEHVETRPVYSKAFFWYLFAMNIVLLASIVALVYRAVVVVYFGAP